MLHAVKSVWGNENRRDSEGKHHTAAGERRTKRTKLIAAKDVQSSVSPSPKKKNIHCISSVQRCGTDCCCDQTGQTQLSLLRVQKSHKPQKENHPCPWRQLKRADMFELRRDWMNLWNNMALRCSSGQLPAVGCFHRGWRLNSRKRPLECARTWAVCCRVSGMRRPQTRLCLCRDKGILYAVVSGK